MKYISIFVLFALTVAVVSRKKFCANLADCAEHECCVTKTFLPFIRGRCEKLETEGKRCSEKDSTLWNLGRKYYSKCPCADGLECIPKETMFIPFVGIKKFDLRCRHTQTTTPEEVTQVVTEVEEVTEVVTEVEEVTEDVTQGEEKTSVVSEVSKDNNEVTDDWDDTGLENKSEEV